MQDSLNYSISQMIWDMKLNFCIWLDIYRSQKFIQSFLVGVVSHAWEFSEVFQNNESALSVG